MVGDNRYTQRTLNSYTPPRIPMPDDEMGGGVAEMHPDYARFELIWEKCRDVIFGEDAVKDAGEKYLPMMRGMDPEDYDAYKERAMFYGATGRTIQGLLGAIFRKDPVLEGPPILSEWARNITQDGKTLLDLSRDVVMEQLSIGRLGILVDMPSVASETAVPYMRVYKAEDITNWREVLVNGIPFLDQVIIRELLAEPSMDGFGSNFFVRYRVLEIVEGVYVQRIFELDDLVGDGEHDEFSPARFVEKERIIPLRRGKPLNFIPFFFVNAENLDVEVQRPPLLDLVNVNLSHYRSSADLEHGRHFTALPTPVVSGVDQNEDQNDNSGALRIGSGTAWVLPEGASARMLEFNGQGLKHLENALVEKNELMVNLGARMLETNKRAAETAEALRLRQAGDQSTLLIVSSTSAEAITKALRAMAWWGDYTQNVNDQAITFDLNRDFFEARMGAQELTALVQAWQNKAIPFTDLYENLLRGEIIGPDRDKEEVRAELLEDVTLENEIAIKKAQGQKEVIRLTTPPQQVKPA